VNSELIPDLKVLERKTIFFLQLKIELLNDFFLDLENKQKRRSFKEFGFLRKKYFEF